MHTDMERRKHKRIEKPIIVRFRISPDNEQEMAFSEWDMVGVNDFSVGGLFFNSSNNIQNGTILDLKIGFCTSSTPVQVYRDGNPREKATRHIYIWYCCSIYEYRRE